MSYVFPSVSIYFHHIDGYFMNNLKKRLIEENFNEGYVKYKIVCTIKDPQSLLKIMHGQHPVEVVQPTQQNFIEKIIECDVLIFKLVSESFEEVHTHARKVFAALEKWANEQLKVDALESPPSQKYLIIVSTPMTWALTPPPATDREEEEGNEMDGYLFEDYYERRKAHPRYYTHKHLERDAIWLQNRCKNLVKSLVVCPGVTYGRKNYVFHYIFKLAYYNKRVPVVSPGSQLIPMIYLADLVEIMKKIIDDFPDSKHRYLLVVQPTLIPLKKFTYNVCRAFIGDCSKIRFVQATELMKMDSTLFSQYVLDVTTLNIKLAPTYFKDYPFHEISDNLWDELVFEYRDARILRPLRIVIDGPPLVGKTEHAQKLAEYYQINYINMRDIVNINIRYLEQKIADSIRVIDSFEFPSQTNFECEEEGDEDEILARKASCEMKGEEYLPRKFDADDEYLLEELKYRIGGWSAELFTLKEYVASHKAYLQWDFEHLSRCLIYLLSTKSYNDNQGYVLDGFPFTYEQAKQIFYHTRRIDVHVGDVLEEDMDSLHRIISPVPTSPLTPTHFIMLDSTYKLLCNRAMGFTETEATTRRCLRHEMLPRLDSYRARNEEPFCLANIFYDHQLIPINILIEHNTYLADTIRKIKTEIGQPYTYPPTEDEQNAMKKVLAEKQAKEEEEERRKRDELISSLTLERERKLLEWNKKYEEIQKHEDEQRQSKTLPLRQYLRKNILPTLTEGILKVSELKPDEPVDFLSDYLFRCNPEEQQMQPFCSDEQRKRFFNAFDKDLSSDSDYFFDKEAFRR